MVLTRRSVKSILNIKRRSIGREFEVCNYVLYNITYLYYFNLGIQIQTYYV